MSGIVHATLYPLRWLAFQLREREPPAPSPAALRLPGTRRASAG